MLYYEEEDQEQDYLRMLDEERDELDLAKEASHKKHDYREIMYFKEDVLAVEKKAIKELLEIDSDLSKYSDAFVQKALIYFPELTEQVPAKKRRGKKSNQYFLEPVGRHLWEKWNTDKSKENQTDFVTYLFTIIDGVIFKYGRHKHGLSYGEVFQGAVIKLIQAMDKFDPQRQVGTDDNGNPKYARVYTYFTMILNYGITTITMAHGGDKIRNVSYEAVSRVFGVEDRASDAAIVFQEFLMFLDSCLVDADVPEEYLPVLTKLSELLKQPDRLGNLSNNLIFTLRAECGLKQKEIVEAMTWLRTEFGPLVIFSEKTSFAHMNVDESY